MKKWLIATFAALSLLATGTASADGGAGKVVFQVSEDSVQTWNLALNNAGNVLKAMGDKAEVEIVAYGHGIGMLMADAKTAARVTQAVGAGVRVVACQNTMRAKKLSKEQMNASIAYVPSGVVEIMGKQQAGWSYVRP